MLIYTDIKLTAALVLLQCDNIYIASVCMPEYMQKRACSRFRIHARSNKNICKCRSAGAAQTQAAPSLEGRTCNWGQSTCFSALVSSRVSPISPLVISPAKCLSWESSDNNVCNPAPLRFDSPCPWQDVIAQKHLFRQMVVDFLKGRFSWI